MQHQREMPPQSMRNGMMTLDSLQRGQQPQIQRGGPSPQMHRGGPQSQVQMDVRDIPAYQFNPNDPRSQMEYGQGPSVETYNKVL